MTGIGSSGATSDIQQIGTGLSYSTTAASTGGHNLSVAYDTTGGNWVVFADFAPGANDCWMVLDITGPGTVAVPAWTGVTVTTTGTYYAVVHNSSNTACKASLIPTNGTINGFPAG
jgi:hypothetical protein